MCLLVGCAHRYTVTIDLNAVNISSTVYLHMRTVKVNNVPDVVKVVIQGAQQG